MTAQTYVENIKIDFVKIGALWDFAKVFALHIIVPIRICFLPLGKMLLIICTLGFKKANTYFHSTMPAKGKKIILDNLGLCYNRISDCQLSSTSLSL